MTKTETARLLTLIAAFDRRTIGETDVEAWHLVIGDLEADDCAAAVKDHFTTETSWLMPAHVRTFALVQARRRASLARQAELERQVAEENPGVNAKAVLSPQPGQLSGGPAPDVAAALVPVKQAPRFDHGKRPAELLAEAVAAAKREAAGTEEERIAALAAAKADHDVARAAAEAEVRRLEASREEAKADA